MPQIRPVSASEAQAPEAALRHAHVAFWTLLIGAAVAVLAWAVPALSAPHETALEKDFVPLVFIIAGLLAAPVEITVLIIAISRLVLSRDAGPLPTQTWLRPVAIILAIALIIAPAAWLAWGFATS